MAITFEPEIKNVDRRSLAVRLVHGVTDHLILRASDWIMTSLVIWFGIAIVIRPQSLTNAVYSSFLLQYADAASWGYFALVVGGLRFAALFVNGTFPSFVWSPYIRAGCALLSVFVWFQISLALFVISVDLSPLWIVVPHLILIDLFNVFVASGEAGADRVRNGRRK